MTPAAKLQPNEYDMLRMHIAYVGEFMGAFELHLPRTWDDSADDSRLLWANLIAEEFSELTDATTTIDRLDAFCDLHYVGIGGHLSCGFRCEQIAAGGYQRPLQKAVGEARTQLIKVPVCQAGCKDALPSLVLTTLRAGKAMFPKFNEAFAAVHDNNMQKLWTEAPKDSQYTVKAKVYAKAVRYLVKRASDGKVIKPPNHVKVDLSKYV